MKSKSPTFQFYAADFFMDTIDWEEEMVGLHIRLMCKQWINDGIEADGDYPAGLTQKQREIFDKIRHKYFIEKDGKFHNKRLKKYKKEKNEFIKNARKSGQKGATARWKGDSKPHTEPNGVPYANPNGETMALQSSSSSSNTTNVVVEKSNPFFEMFRRSAGRHISDAELLIEVGKFENKYPNVHPNQAGALINAWVANIGKQTSPAGTGTIQISQFA